MTDKWSRADLPAVYECESFGLVSGRRDRRVADDVLHFAVDRLNRDHPKPPLGGHWTRDDLPDAMELTSVYLEAEGGSENAFIEVLDAVVDHLDAHHPKPVPYDEGGITGPRLYMPIPEAWRQPPRDFSGVGWKAMYERGIEKRVEVLNRAARAERERDELREQVRNIGEGMVRAQNQRGEMRRERDEWKAHAEAAEARAEADNRYSGTPNHAFVEGALWATRHLHLTEEELDQVRAAARREGWRECARAIQDGLGAWDALEHYAQEADQ